MLPLVQAFYFGYGNCQYRYLPTWPSAHVGPIIGFMNGEEERLPEYSNIATMIEAIATALSKKIIFVDEGGTLEMDDDNIKVLQKNSILTLNYGKNEYSF